MKKFLLPIALATAALAQADEPGRAHPAQPNQTGKLYSTRQREAPGQPGVVQTTPVRPVVIAPPPPPPILLDYRQRPSSRR
ncbi:MAG: hypothetical protein QM740_19395 [Acidovorax sp.]